METKVNFVDLLEEINSAPIGREPNYNSLVENFLKKGVPQAEIGNLIDAAWKNMLIKDKYNPIKETQKDDAHADRNTLFILNLPGIEFLNQIKIKKAIETLDDSINKFNESSDRSSEKLIDLTWAIYTFTIIVAALPIIEKTIQLYNVSPIAEIVWLIISFVFIAFLMYIFYKIYEKR